MRRLGEGGPRAQQITGVDKVSVSYSYLPKLRFDPYLPITKGQILEVQASLVLGAPDAFFRFDDAPEYMQQTLESTIYQLHIGVDHVFRKERHAQAREQMHEIIRKAYYTFKDGSVHDGRSLGFELEDLIRDTKP